MRALFVLPLVGLGLVAAGCTPLRARQGYVIDADLVNSVQPGVDNRDSIAKVLGHPTYESQFGPKNWYYISRDTKNFAFSKPKPTAQTTIEISFDAAGNVAAVRKSNIEQVASIRPYGKTTPTLGRKRSFFSDLFGNIGTVGAGGVGGGPDGSNTGGGS